MEKTLGCCFFGQRRLPKDRIEQIVIRLDREIENLINQGVTDYIFCGGLGFDLLAASLIIAKKEMGKKIHLIFTLPFIDQDKFWSDEQRNIYRSLLGEADEIIYISEEYTDGCIKKRNRYMVDNSAYCIYAWLHPFSGTDQTVRYARQKGVKVINVAE